MKKLTSSIIGIILCTSPVFASASTVNCPTKEEILNKLKNEINITENDITYLKSLSLKDLLNKLGCLTGGIEIPKPDFDINKPQAPENNTPEIPDVDIPGDNNSGESIPEADKSFELQVLDLINEERTSRGLSALKYSEELSKVARAHSADMANRGYFSHNTPEGLTPFNRIKNAGISYKTAGENIAAGQKTPEAVVEAWMNSDGHRANILNASYTETGIGLKYGGSYGIYWTQLFKG